MELLDAPLWYPAGTTISLFLAAGPNLPCLRNQSLMIVGFVARLATDFKSDLLVI